MDAILAKGKYTLLFHTGKGLNHYDLVLEGNDLCPTFQFVNKELTLGKRIKDHQVKYLTFEGVISPEKGTVSIIEQGEFKLTDNHLKLKSIQNRYSFICNAEYSLLNLIN